MKAIALGNKFHVLWNIEDKVKTYHDGAYSIEYTYYNYIKVVAKDKAKALAKYPDAVEMEELNGKTKSFRVKKSEPVWCVNNVFRFGKYYMQKINECTDYNYMNWYLEHITGEHKAYVESILLNNGYIKRNRIVKIGLRKINKKYIIYEKEELFNDRITKEIKTKMPFNITLKKNLTLDGIYREGKYVFKFDKIKQFYYDVYIYSLPLIKGKAKRIKNKEITIYRYTVENNIITILDFEMAK